MKLTTAVIADVERALESFKVAAQADARLEHESRKRLAAAVEALTPKDDVTKLLKQAYTYGENWWAKNVLNDEHDGCTKENKLEKIKLHIMGSSAYSRLIRDDATKSKAERWLSEKFRVTVDPEIEEAT